MNRQARYNNNSKVETHPVIGCTWFPWIFNKKRIKTKLAPPPPNAPPCKEMFYLQKHSNLLACENFQLRPCLRLVADLTNAQRGPAPESFIPREGNEIGRVPVMMSLRYTASMSSSMSSILLASSTYADHTTVTGYTFDWKFFKCAVRYVHALTQCVIVQIQDVKVRKHYSLHQHHD